VRLSYQHHPKRHDIASNLKGEDLILELAHGAGLLIAEGLGGLLDTADHGGRAAQEDLDVVGRLGQPFLRLCVSCMVPRS
jgi:hypothetical protein